MARLAAKTLVACLAATRPTERGQQAVKVLLIAPYAPLARALRRCLEEENCTVDVAVTPAEGEARLGAGAYDALVLDLDPPQGQGLTQLAGWRRRGLTTPALLLVVPDGNAGPCPTRSIALTKPFDLGDFLTCLRALLRQRGDPETDTMRPDYSPWDSDALPGTAFWAAPLVDSFPRNCRSSGD